MDWISVALFVGGPLLVAYIAYEVGRSFRAFAGTPHRKGPSYSPGEAVWMAIWALGLTAAWLAIFL